VVSSTRLASLLFACCATALAATAQAPVAKVVAAPAAGEKGGPGLALRTKKALTVPLEGRQFLDDALILVKDGIIVGLGPARTTPVPAGFEVQDLGRQWVMPGMIDLHSHIGGTFDINEMVYLVNPGLQVSTSVVPANPALEKALASGVTTVLFIPGSGVNVGGQGVLIKTGLDKYEDALVRDPGSMKLAQAGNPEGWAIGVGRSFMNWNTRDMFERGMLYAQQWREFEAGRGPKPVENFDLQIFRDLLDKKTQISTHTQIYQVVLSTLTMVRKGFGIDVYIDHGEMAGYKLAAFAQELGVQAILGPRVVEVPTRQFIQWTGSNPEALLGIAAEYQKAGHKRVGFNTDAPVIPGEELSLQATMGVRYGFDDSNADGVRGLTIIPAVTAGIDKKVGSLEVGKEADIVVVTGDPVDQRNSVEVVFIGGRRVYDTKRDIRRY
jgi:imidazolonepropionase-like amidohydrolase